MARRLCARLRAGCKKPWVRQMRVIDPGHSYALTHLDGNLEELLTFVKRTGAGYPGNVGSHPGTNLQEVIRVCMDRVKYLDNQIRHVCNYDALEAFRQALWALEVRAPERHGRILDPMLYEEIELQPVCVSCGHVACDGCCRR